MTLNDSDEPMKAGYYQIHVSQAEENLMLLKIRYDVESMGKKTAFLSGILRGCLHDDADASWPGIYVAPIGESDSHRKLLSSKLHDSLVQTCKTI